MPRALDLFCGAGGAAMGLHRAGFDVVGVDIKPQPRYPFTFVQGDALAPPFRLSDFDLVWASPPCQAYTTMSNRWRGDGGKADSHPALIAPIRDMLNGCRYVIENVPGAARLLLSPVRLSGGMFGLGVERARLFECSFMVLAPQAARVKDPVGIYGKLDGRRVWTRKDGSTQRAARSIEEARAAMDMPWSDWRGLAEAIPPAYSEHIAQYALMALEARP